MKKAFAGALAIAALAISAPVALAGQPVSGQNGPANPGHQGGGPTGYEGQPGNQSS